MSDDTRYVRVACACGADWIEDRMEPGPSCPVCGHQEPWGSVEDCSRLFPQGPAKFGLPASKVIDLLERCAFTGSLTEKRRGSDAGRWAYEHQDGGTAWTILIDIEVFREEDRLRSVLLAYWVDGKPALAVTVLTAEKLIDIIATIVRTIQGHSGSLVAAAEGLFCHGAVEAA